MDLAEANIKQLDAKVFHEKDTAVVLGREADRLRAEVQLYSNPMKPCETPVCILGPSSKRHRTVSDNTVI